MLEINYTFNRSIYVLLTTEMFFKPSLKLKFKEVSLIYILVVRLGMKS